MKKRLYELEAHANETGYSVTLRINGKAFKASASAEDGNTVGNTYRQIVSQIREVYGDIEREEKYADIVKMREQVYFVICSLSKICKGGAQ
nr:MAG TPA: hypothetical protein [Caudoviricetes sp.]